MKVDKVSENTYRVRKMYKGQKYTLYFDHKPSQKEIMQNMSEEMDNIPVKNNGMTLYKAYLDYLESKSNILSPSTKRGYKTVINAIPDRIKEMHIIDVDNITVQRFVNEYSHDHSPKTTKNVYGLIATIIKIYAPNTKLNVQLPQAIKNEPYIPTEEEVKAIMDELKGGKYYIPTALAALGLRKSEICGLQISDLDENNMLTINKALVSNENNELVIKKTTKTVESTRNVYIPEELAEMIRQQGYIYKGFPDCITRNLKRVQKKLGIQEFPLHKMRHFFASYAHNELKLSDAQIMELGGWKSTEVLHTVYRHAMEKEQAKKYVAESMKSLF